MLIRLLWILWRPLLPIVFLEDPGDLDISEIIQEVFDYLQLYISAFFRYFADALSTVAQNIWDFLADIFPKIGSVIRNIWTRGLKVFFQRIVDTIKKSHAWNELRHGHILAFLRELRKLLDTLYLNHIRPILVLLQQIRQFLQVLRMLHINIGAQLDRIIADIEGKIAGTFLQIRAVLNTAVDLLNILVDGKSLLDSPHLLISLRRIVAALSVILTRRPLGYWFPSPRGASAGFEAPVPFDPTNPSAFNLAPASSFLAPAYGIKSVPPIDIGYKIDVTHIEKIDALDFFDDSLWAAPACSDPAQCLNEALQILVNAPANG